MIRFKRKITIPFLLLLFLLFAQTSYSQDQDVLEILEIIQKDLKTLEKAVYSDAGSEDLSIKTEFNQNEEDVLTRHLLKLSEIEDQFKNLSIHALHWSQTYTLDRFENEVKDLILFEESRE